MEVFHDKDYGSLHTNCIHLPINCIEFERIKKKINNYSTEEFDKVLFKCGIEDIKLSAESDYVKVMKL